MKPKGSQFFWTKTQYNEAAGNRRSPEGHANNPQDPRAESSTSYHLYSVDEDFKTRAHGHMDVEWPIETESNAQWMSHSSWQERAKAGLKPIPEKPTGTSQQMLFDKQSAGRRPNGPTVTWAQFSKEGTKRFGEALGVAQNDSTARGFGRLEPDPDLSDNSGPMVERLQAAGHVSPDFEQTETNQMEFMSSYPEVPHGDAVKDPELSAGRQTIRKVLGGPRREQIRQQKAQRNQLQLPF